VLPPLPVLDPLYVRGRGRPYRALGSIATSGSIRATLTCREPSAFEALSSSALSTYHRTDIQTGQVYIVPRRAITAVAAIERLESSYIDLYKAGTRPERAYMGSISGLYQGNMADSASVASEVIQRDLISSLEQETE
jgi:hypothetical protein